ncbi:MAG: site-specific integrase, partial [Planctomycetes bacterium]|nr:site-specific integrase [Planctomycetota bacterium]
MSHIDKLPGSIYLNNGRYYWRVKLPGDTKRQAIALRPTGSAHATKDHKVAVKLASIILEKHIFDSKPKSYDGKISGLAQAYLKHCQSYYRKSREPENIKNALSWLLKQYANESPEEFGPLKLKALRDKMIKARHARSTINKRIGMIKRMFNWAAENEMIHESTASALYKVKNLQADRSDAKETEPIRPVDIRVFNKVVDHAGYTIGDMMRLQLLTGMRSSELCTLRPVDIQTKGKIWFYTPTEHKTKHKGKERVIAIGPQAQAVLKPYLDRKVDTYCFNPQEALQQMYDDRHAARTTPLHYGNAPGTNRKTKPKTSIGNQYN